jgi:hypothetical protein
MASSLPTLARRVAVPAPRLRHLALLALIAAATLAAPASAQPWSRSIDGVDFGWEDSGGTHYEYAWAAATDETIAELGARSVTSIACRALTRDARQFTKLCEQLVRPAVDYVIATEWASTANTGHWIKFYPHVSPYVFHGSY